MKRLFIFIIALFLLTGCSTTNHHTSYVSSKCYIGMSVEEFKKLAGKNVKIEAMEKDLTVYRLSDYDIWTDISTDTKFFYFDKESKLIRVDGGVIRGSNQTIDVKIKKD